MSDRARHAREMALDFDGWLERLPEPQRNTVRQQLGRAPDPEAERRALTNSAWLIERTGLPPRVVNDNYDKVRAGWGERAGWGDAWKDDATFHARVVSEAATERDEEVMLQGFDGDTHEARRSRSQSLANMAYAAGSEDANIRDDGHMVEAFSKWQAQNQEKPTYRGKRAGDYYAAFAKAYAIGAGELQEARAVAETITPILAKIDDWSGPGLDEALPHFAGLTGNFPRQFELTMREVRRIAGKGEQGKPGLNIPGSVNRGARSLAESIKGFITGMDADMAESDADFHRDLARHTLRSQIIARLQQTAQESVSPIVAESFLGTMLNLSAESVPAMVSVWATGGAANMMAYTHDADVALTENGVPPEVARGAAPIVGGVQAALDRVQLSLLKKFPGLDRVLQKYATSAVTKIVGRTAATGVAETGIELAQDKLAPALMQDLLAALHEDVPGNDWERTWEEMKQQAPSAFLAMLPLALVGGGAATWRDFKNFRDIARDPDLQQAAGFTPSHIAAINLAETDQQAAEIVRKLWGERVVPKRTPEPVAAPSAMPDGEGRGPDAPSVAGTAGGVEGIAEAAPASEAALNAAAGIQALRRDDDGWNVVMEDGSRVQVGTVEAAQHLRGSLLMAKTKQEADAYISILDSLHAPGKVTTVTGEAVEGQKGGGVTALSPGGELRQVDIGAAVKELDAELSLLGVDSAAIQGSNFVREGVQNIVLNQSREGALTALHENAEAAWKAGRITPEETKAAAFVGFTLFENATDKAGKETALRLQRISLGKATETEARETMVELAVANELGQRKNGSRFVPGSLTAAVDAAIRRNRDAGERRALGRFRSYLRAVRAFMRAVFATAAKIAKARREGQDLEALDKLTDKLLGMDAERRHGQAVEKELAETFSLARPESSPPAGADTFSLSPASLLDRLAGEIAARITDPKERLEAYRRAHESFLGMARAIRFNDDVAGAVSRAEIDRERVRRKAAREEELLQEVDRAFGDLSGEEFISKALNNPVLDELFSKKPGEKFPRSMIRSRTSAERAGRRIGGEYDGSGDLPSWIFGGRESPDTMAQMLFERGLIREPTTDAMWNEIGKALKSAGAAKDRLRSYAEAKRKAREQAAAEAQEWADEQLRELPERQESRGKKDMARFMAALDSLLVVLPSEIRGKVGGFIRMATLETNKARAEFLKNRIEKMDRVFEEFLRKEYSRRLTELFERADKNAREPGEKPKSHVGADAHSLLMAMKAAMTLDETATDAELARLDALVASGTLTPEQEAMAIRQRELVNLAGDWKNASAAERAAAWEAADDTFSEGWLAWSRRITERRERREAIRQALIRDTGKAGTKVERDARAEKDMGWRGSFKNFALSLSSFEEAARYIFGASSKEASDFVDRERDAANAKDDEIQNASDEIEDFFTELAGGAHKGRSPYRGTQLRHRMAQPSIDAGASGKLSEFQAVQFLMMWGQPDGRRHMESDGVTAEEVNSVASQLSDEGRRWMEFVLGKYSTEYSSLNALFRDRQGVNLPQHDNYAPLTVKPILAKGGEILDPVTGAPVGASLLTPGSLRSRSRVAKAEPDYRDSLQVYLAHRRQMSHWKFYYDLATDMQAALAHRELGNAVQAKGGEQALKVLRSWKDFFAQGGNRDAAAFLSLNQQVGKMASLAAQMILVGRAGTLAVQSVQLGASLAEMPFGSYVKRLGMLFAGRLDWGDALRSGYIQRRMATAPPIVRQALDRLATAEPSRAKHAAAQLGKLIAGADAVFTSGTYAILLDYHRANGAKLGLSGPELDAHAHLEAERGTERVAQPVRSGTRSLMENLGAGAWMRVAWSFASDPRQKIAMAAWSLRYAKNNPARAARVAAVVWGAGGLGVALIRTAWRDMKDDDDEEVFDARTWNVKRILLSAGTGPLQGIPILGEVFESGIHKAFGVYMPTGDTLSQMAEGGTAARKLVSGATAESEEPVEDTLKAAKTIMLTLGLWNEQIAAAYTLANVAEDAAKIVDNIEGKD